MSRPRTRPLAARWLRARLPFATWSATLGDLDEEFTHIAATLGAWRAELWFIRQVWSVGRAYGRQELAGGGRLLKDVGAGLRLSFTHLRRHPGYALIAVCSLAVGIASITTTAALSDAVLRRPIGQQEPDLVRRLGHRAGGPEGLAFSFPELDHIRESVGDSGRVAGATLTPALIRIGNTSTQDLIDVAVGPLHEVLGLRPLHGRLLTAEDDRPGQARVVVVAEHFWRTHLDGTADVVGRHVAVNGQDYVVVGVAPTQPSLGYFGVPAAGWVPAATADSLLTRGWRTDATQRPFVGLVRLTHHNRRSDLDGRLQRATTTLAAALPDRWRDRTVTTSDGLLVTGVLRRTAAILAGLLSAMAALVLVVAATNVGGLVFAHAAARRRANAIRVALGAGRQAIVMHTLSEGLILGLGGGALSLLLYAWFASAARAIAIQPTIVLRLDLPIDGRTLALTVATSLVAAVLTTMMPAVSASRAAVSHTMDSITTRQMGDTTTGRTRRWLLSAQLSASMVLIVLATLFARSLQAIEMTPLGVDIDRIAAFDLDIEPMGASPEATAAMAEMAVAKVQALAGVASVAMASRAPVDSSTPTGEVRIHSGTGEIVVPDVTRLDVTPTYFHTVGIQLVDGRLFTPADVDRPVAIINESLARKLGGAQTIQDVDAARTLHVIGVVRDSKYRAVTEGALPHFYRPVSPRFQMALIVRTHGDPAALFQEAQRALDSVGPGIQGFFPRTGRDHLRPGLLTTHVSADVARVLGVIAACLAALGLFGLLQWLVQARRSELGLRLALGASRSDLQRLVFGQAVRHAWPGIAAGLVAAMMLALVLRSQLFGVTFIDPVVIVIVVVSQLAIVAIASWLPARQAGQVSAVELLH